MTTIPTSPLLLNAGIGMRRKLLVVDASGLATIDLVDHGAVLQVPHGVALHGLRLISDGQDAVLDDDVDYAVNVVTLGLSTLIHESPLVAAPYRFLVTDGAPASSDTRRYFVFYSKISGVWRWDVARWF